MAKIREFGESANLITLARIVLTPLFVWWFTSADWRLKVLGFVVFVAAAITDWWDGHHARKHKTVSNLGKFLDPLADKLLTIAAMLTLAYEHLVQLWMILVIFARDFWLTWLRVRAANAGKVFVTSRLAKFKTAVQMTAIITIIGLWCIYSIANTYQMWPGIVPEYWLVALFNVMIAATMLLALVSGFQYLRRSTG